MFTRSITRCGIFAVLAMIITGQVAISENKAKVAAQQVVDQLEAIVALTADQKSGLLNQCQGFFKMNPQAIPDSDGAQLPPDEAYSVFFLPGPVFGVFEANLTFDQKEIIDAYNLKQGVVHRLNLIDRTVALTDSQRVDIKPILEKEVSSQIRLRGNLIHSRETDYTRRRLAEIRGETDTVLASLLTEEQFERYMEKDSADSKTQ